MATRQATPSKKPKPEMTAPSAGKATTTTASATARSGTKAGGSKEIAPAQVQASKPAAKGGMKAKGKA